MSSPDDSRPAPFRRRRVIGGAVAALVALAVVLLGLALRGGDGAGNVAAAGTATSAPAGTSSSAAPGSATPPEEPAPGTPEQAAPTGDASELPPALPAVALDEEASGADGVSAQVVSLEAIDGTAQGPGNIAGAALRATVRLENGTDEPLALDLVVVNLTHGTDGTPASPLQDASRVPFTGTLAPGEAAEGVYVFTVPADARDVVTLTVGYRAGAPFLVFTGAAG
ncbi:hypothetical protein ACI782_01495 [Geodermatophilus sp. SYSU D00703]